MEWASDARTTSEGSADHPGSPLPPGQRSVDGFPRFGTHLRRPPPPVPPDPVIEIGGMVTESLHFPVAELAALPRRELRGDFHCVAGWSATDLRWEGVPFDAFYQAVISPAQQQGATISHLVFGGLDGYWSVVDIEDAMAGDVLIADGLNGRPLEPDHGAPVRLVSLSQYGFMSTKHLCRIELHTHQPAPFRPASIRIGRAAVRTPLIKTHPRARVWREERHPYLPAWLLRNLYWRLVRRTGSLTA